VVFGALARFCRLTPPEETAMTEPGRDGLIDTRVERSIEHAVFRTGRDSLTPPGTAMAWGGLGSVLPMDRGLADAPRSLGPPEKKNLGRH
jgi:hypothetical protein